jgi:hypothetical protein
MANKHPGGENRAHLEKGGSINRPTPATADRSAQANPWNDIPRDKGICSSDHRTSAAPLNSRPHKRVADR